MVGWFFDQDGAWTLLLPEDSFRDRHGRIGNKDRTMTLADVARLNDKLLLLGVVSRMEHLVIMQRVRGYQAKND